MGIQQGLPIPHLPHPLLAPQVLLHIRRPRRVVELVPVGLAMGILPLGPLLLPTPAALPLLTAAARVVVLVFFGSGPVGEGASWWLGRCGCGGWSCGGRRCCCGCGGRGGGGRRGFGESGFGFGGLFDLRAADRLEAKGCARLGIRLNARELGGLATKRTRVDRPLRLGAVLGAVEAHGTARDGCRSVRVEQVGIQRHAAARRLWWWCRHYFLGIVGKLVEDSSLAREAEAVINKFEVELQI